MVPPFESIISPIKDGDIEFPQNHLYRNSYFINANSKFPPGIVDISLEPITDPKKVCSGMYCRASISFYFYNHEDRYGIGCTLNGLQLLQGGVSTAASDFADFKDIADDLF